ncbi:ABC transporter permease subunit [Conexibacter sp. JD483]|uniref:ABC transporter permease n=1 Tax=unclassified Conexibacter TaxID=2627773 RepID=UPI00271F9E20|nr:MULTISPECIES: ABC transporter permease subunit [unclassified Conexibacter]MDO8187931.1 ABC transporter permease subunit [Conexibacter sp. CPCC 205706]MDO8200200.1 ABC transporter permease subunit [Conexibacter sp. CPCC 205762]MDR9369746.1 ABC transporter permease subunit [Conexibacter sp. JD483]
MSGVAAQERSAAIADPLADPLPPPPARRSRRQLAATAGWALLSTLLLLGLWQLVSWRVGADVLPGPLTSVRAIRFAVEDGYLWSDMAATGKRMAGAFLLALVAGTVAGIVLGRSRIAALLFGSWVTILSSIPSLLLIVVTYLAIGLSDRGAIIGAALVVLPTLTFSVWQGVKALDPDLGEVARAFGVGRLTTVRRVLLPQTLPFMFAAARLGLALTWKITIFVEVLGRSDGVGYRIQYWYNTADMQRVIGSALPFVLLMLTLELAVLRPLERHLFRWQREEAR